jgi:hypothetical protein
MIAADCSMRKLAISGTQGRCAAFRAPAKAASRTNRRSTFVVRATDAPTDQEKKDAEELKALSAKLGLPTDEGIFGFKPFAEVWTGRLAMGGFISSIAVEFLTGKGTLQQLGLVTPSFPLFVTIIALGGGAITIGSWRTILRATNNELTANELVRYRQLLGIQNEEKNIAAQRAQGSIADKFLGDSDDKTNKQKTEGVAAETAASDQSSLGQGTPKYTSDDIVTDKNFANEGLAYARDVEVNNGRWAMIGFISALSVEALTGRGIIGQVISYLKLSGLLGEKSGF